jgi:transcription elongation factor Elf1
MNENQIIIDNYNNKIKEEEESIKILEKKINFRLIPMTAMVVILIASCGAVFFCTGIIHVVGITSVIISGCCGKILAKNIMSLSKEIDVHGNIIDENKKEIEELKQQDYSDDDAEITHFTSAEAIIKSEVKSNNQDPQLVKRY